MERGSEASAGGSWRSGRCCCWSSSSSAPLSSSFRLQSSESAELLCRQSSTLTSISRSLLLLASSRTFFLFEPRWLRFFLRVCLFSQSSLVLVKLPMRDLVVEGVSVSLVFLLRDLPEDPATTGHPLEKMSLDSSASNDLFCY